MVDTWSFGGLMFMLFFGLVAPSVVFGIIPFALWMGERSGKKEVGRISRGVDNG